MTGPAAPPRYFWRRFAAFAIDLFCASLAGAALALLLAFASSERTHLSKGVLSAAEHCKDYDPIPQVFIDWAGQLEVKQATVCTYRPYFVFPYQRRLTLRTGAHAQDGGGPVFVHIYAVDQNRKLKPLLELDILLGQFVLLLGSAFCLMQFGTTPGKWLVELRVQGHGCALCRELRRTGPVLALSALPVLMTQTLVVTLTHSRLIFVEAAGPELVSWPAAFAVYGVFAAAAGLYYIRPWIWWRGAMPYDHATGFRVVRR